MPASQARIATVRAGRYLTQLCKHSNQTSALAHGHGHRDGDAGSLPRHAEWSDTDGVIDFGWGRCTLNATGEALLLHAEADEQRQLERIQDALTARLERIGRRDDLTVTWWPAPPTGRRRAGREPWLDPAECLLQREGVHEIESRS